MVCIYPSINIEHLPIIGSNHVPILTDTNARTLYKPKNLDLEPNGY